MKRLLLLALAVPTLFSSCMTREVIAKAQGKPFYMYSDDELNPNPMPLYYAMLPISVPVDLAFMPIGIWSQIELAKQRAKCN